MNKKKLFDAMSNYQYLEFILKAAIGFFENTIREQVSDLFNYPVNQDKIDNMTLTPLAKKYSQYTNDKTFKNKVKTIKTSRDRLAHVMFLRSGLLDFVYDGDAAHDEDIESMLKSSQEAHDLAEYLIQEMHKYRQAYKSKLA